MPKISLNVDELTAEKAQLSEFLARPDAYADPKYGILNRRLSELDAIIATVNERHSL